MFFSPNQLLLYQLFLSHPTQAFYLQEIGRILDKKPGVFQRTLNKLEEDQFVISEFQANARFFKLNKVYPLTDEIKSMILKLGHPLNPFEQKIIQLEKHKSKRKSRKKRSDKVAPEMNKTIMNGSANIPATENTPPPYARSLAEIKGDEISEKRFVHTASASKATLLEKPSKKKTAKNSSQLELF